MGDVAGCSSRGRFCAYDVVRVVLGLVLLTAAALKAHQLATGAVIAGENFDSEWLISGAILVEGLLALWLCAGVLPIWGWRFALFCFSLFSVISFAKGLAGAQTCGCFGDVETSPWGTLILDAVAVFALACCRPVLNTNCGRFRQLLELVAVTALLATVTIASADVAGHEPSQGSSTVGTELECPGHWVGHPFALLDRIDIGDQLTVGQWLVLLYRPGCEMCERLIQEYESAQGCGLESPRQTALIALNRGKAHNSYYYEGFYHGELTRVAELQVHVPLEIVLEDGLVTAINCGQGNRE